MSGGNRPSICTLDGLNCVAITTRFHFDAGGYWYRPNSASTTPQSLDNGVNARRARIGLLGTVMGGWDQRLIYDFRGSFRRPPPLSRAPDSGNPKALGSYTG